MKLLEKIHWNTKIRIAIKKKYHRAKKVKMHHRMKRKHLKRSPRKIKTHHQIQGFGRHCKRIYIIGDSILKHVQGYEISKSLENCKTCEIFLGC